MMVDFEMNELLQDSLPYAYSGAVFLSASDGKLKSVNQLAEKWIDEIELFDGFLPADHRGLIMACLRTRMPLKKQCILDGMHLTWSYQTIDKISGNSMSKEFSDYVCIYAQGFPPVHASGHGVSLPALSLNKPVPNVRFTRAGELQFINSDTSMLLADLKIENIEELLPRHHRKLIQACTVSEIAFSETRVRNGKKYNWIYQSGTENSEINIYAQKVTELSYEGDEVISEQSEDASLNIFVDELMSIKTINFAIYRLLDKLKLSSIDEILPSTHAGLIKACLATRTILTKKCDLSCRTVVWSYQPLVNDQGVCVFGYEV